MSKRELVDDGGNALPKIDPTTDLGRMCFLLEWARIRGYKLGPMVQIGDIVVQVEDMRLRAGKDLDDTEAPDIFAAHGHMEK